MLIITDMVSVFLHVAFVLFFTVRLVVSFLV